MGMERGAKAGAVERGTHRVDPRGMEPAANHQVEPAGGQFDMVAAIAPEAGKGRVEKIEPTVGQAREVQPHRVDDRIGQCHASSEGSSRARSQSPRIDIESVVRKIVRPGTTASHQALIR